MFKGLLSPCKYSTTYYTKAKHFLSVANRVSLTNNYSLKCKALFQVYNYNNITIYITIITT